MEADAVIAGVGCTEREFAGMRALRVHDTVVIVKYFLDRDGYSEVGIRGVLVRRVIWSL